MSVNEVMWVGPSTCRIGVLTEEEDISTEGMHRGKATRGPKEGCHLQAKSWAPRTYCTLTLDVQLQSMGNACLLLKALYWQPEDAHNSHSVLAHRDIVKSLVLVSSSMGLTE